MNPELHQQIAKFLFNLSNENYAGAHREVKKIVSQKIDARMQDAYKKIQNNTTVKENINTQPPANQSAPIDPNTPFNIYDGHTGQLVKRGIYANRNRLRNLAERKNQEYGSHRYIAKAVFDQSK